VFDLEIGMLKKKGLYYIVGEREMRVGVFEEWS
jgi:hypothetical protein